MKKLVLVVMLFVSLSCFSQTANDSLVDIFDGNHKIMKLNVHLDNILIEMETLGENKYYIRETQIDGTLVECSYIRKENIITIEELIKF